MKNMEATNAEGKQNVYAMMSSNVSDLVYTNTTERTEILVNNSSLNSNYEYYVGTNETTNYVSPQLEKEYHQYDEIYNQNSSYVLHESSSSEWLGYNLSFANLNKSDLYVTDATVWDPKGSFLDTVLGKIFLVPLAIVVGVCIGVLIWGLFVFIYKLFIAVIKILKRIFPNLSNWICCGRFCVSEKNINSDGITKSRTIWYQSSAKSFSSHRDNSHNSLPNLSEYQVTTSNKTRGTDPNPSFVEYSREDKYWSLQKDVTRDKMDPYPPPFVLSYFNDDASDRHSGFHQQAGTNL